MRIISFAVDNFRGISGGLDNNRINFDGSNTIFILGQNNVGKSTFLKAYSFIYSGQTPIEEDFHKKDLTREMQFELELEIDDVDLGYIKESNPRKFDSFGAFLSNAKIKILRRFTSERDAKGKFSKPAARDFTLNPQTKEWEESAFGSLGLSTVFQRLMPKPIIIKAMPTEEEVEKVVNEILASKAASRLKVDEFEALKDAQKTIKELQDKMYNPAAVNAYKQQVNDYFRKLFPDTSIDLEEADKVKWTEDKFGKKFTVHFHKETTTGERESSVPDSYTSIGHGAVRSAIFSLLLMRDIAEEMEWQNNRKEYLILFEEPELFLHPKLMRNLRELIYSVSNDNYPYQILCASHSPQMIDISKQKSTLVRMVKRNSTKLYQVNDNDLLEAGEAKNKEELKQELQEVLRFNPYICESFYADEVLLVEGATEEIIIRGILQKEQSSKDVFVVNCGSVNNIPFYQKVYRKFSIRHHVVCDTDFVTVSSVEENNNPVFNSGVQGTISREHVVNYTCPERLAGLLRVHDNTFETAHANITVHVDLVYPAAKFKDSDGKPYNANRYWKEVLEPNYNSPDIETVHIIRYVKEILRHEWS